MYADRGSYSTSYVLNEHNSLEAQLEIPMFATGNLGKFAVPDDEKPELELNALQEKIKRVIIGWLGLSYDPEGRFPGNLRYFSEADVNRLVKKIGKRSPKSQRS